MKKKSDVLPEPHSTLYPVKEKILAGLILLRRQGPSLYNIFTAVINSSRNLTHLSNIRRTPLRGVLPLHENISLGWK